MHAHDHRAGRQKQQRLEKRVGHEVKHRHRVSRRPQGHRHVAKLGQCGIRHHSLDVVLDNAQKTHEKGGDATRNHHDAQSGVAEFKQR